MSSRSRWATAATFAAGLLAILYIFLGVFTPLLPQPIGAGAQTSPSAALPTVTGPAARPLGNDAVDATPSPRGRGPG